MGKLETIYNKISIKDTNKSKDIDEKQIYDPFHINITKSSNKKGSLK